jgi:hypothetical protein
MIDLLIINETLAILSEFVKNLRSTKVTMNSSIQKVYKSKLLRIIIHQIFDQLEEYHIIMHLPASGTRLIVNSLAEEIFIKRGVRLKNYRLK